MKATADLTTNTWTIDGDSVQNRDLMLYIAFSSGSDLVQFDDLSFGVLITKGEEVGLEEEFPKNETVYVQTDQEWLEHIRLFFDLEDQHYELKLWARNGGEYFEDTFVIYSEPKEIYLGPINPPTE